MNDEPSIKIYLNITDNKITSKINPRCYLELLTGGMMKLLVGTKNKITKDKIMKMDLI